MDDDKVDYTVIYRDVKYPRLEYKTGKLVLILPRDFKDPQQIIQKYRGWIANKERIIREALEEGRDKVLVLDRGEAQLKQLVQNFVEKYQQELGVRVNKILIRKMKTKWASYSRNGNITVNTLVKYLPDDLIAYIIYHEVVHAIERKHNQNFWSIISKKFPDYSAKEKDLLTYWFLIKNSNRISE